MGNRCYRIQSVRAKLYLSALLDLHSSYLISYTISERPVLSMVTGMLDKAFENLPNGTGLILHSDQGWQYQNKYYRQMLKQKGIRQSMSRRVTVWTMLSWKISLDCSRANFSIFNSFNLWNISSRNWWNI